MVKGNADRRRELAAKRKADSKAEGERRRAGAAHATPAEVRSRLLSDAAIGGGLSARCGGEAGLVAWLRIPPSEGDEDDGGEEEDDAEDRPLAGAADAAAAGSSLDRDRGAAASGAGSAGGAGEGAARAPEPPRPPRFSRQAVCEAFFRTGSCPLRRCRASHAESIAHLAGVPEEAGEAAPAPGDAPALSSDDEAGGGGKAGKSGGGKRRGGGGGSGGGRRERGGGGGGGGAESGGGELPAMMKVALRAADPGASLVYSRLHRNVVREPARILFIAWADVLVFDAACPAVFARYAAGEAGAPAVAAASEGSTAPSASGGAVAAAGVALDEPPPACGANEAAAAESSSAAAAADCATPLALQAGSAAGASACEGSVAAAGASGPAAAAGAHLVAALPLPDGDGADAAFVAAHASVAQAVLPVATASRAQAADHDVVAALAAGDPC